MVNRADYAELGLASADVRITLDRGLTSKRLSNLNSSVLEAFEWLRT